MSENEKMTETEKLMKAVEAAEEKIEKCFAELQDSLQKAFACECEKPILTGKEHNYLSSIIKPFRDRVKYISKRYFSEYDEYCIQVVLENLDSLTFPNFEGNIMYKGMEVDKKYTLEELYL